MKDKVIEFINERYENLFFAKAKQIKAGLYPFVKFEIGEEDYCITDSGIVQMNGIYNGKPVYVSKVFLWEEIIFDSNNKLDEEIRIHMLFNLDIFR